ncbi:MULTISPECIES: c-type cytochrome [Flavobacterium]|uniref:C-type cytochrome n=2 Tax=Flavobacterium TaxID=237 RepID=A0AA94JM62_9FLAO|nr:MULTISPECIES: c-type cytochrome [Flavobacterium]OXA78129.1 cytochrome C552 [Flavobacterium columnare] [Flavobacterium columnare NBRC 100251 = ATCC 23463]AMA50375.1 cytochrome C552 [Flavobacterium covae]AND64083.1 cytochrome C552 [Flavobacterium covae]MCH4829611.1 c-type cytochrome [Flavobacterium columnare]MCH4831392.1 c-type cytochrome [Flavobacterium columnare]
MKKLLLLSLIGIIFSCKKESQERFGKSTSETIVTQKPIDLGKEIFEGKGVCYTCHKPDIKTVGPSLKEIAKLYKEKNGSIVDFLQEKSQPIVDPSQYNTMKANFPITKNLPKEELKAIETYILSF